MITAIHSGGDWADACAEYLILPDGMDIRKELAAYNAWYRDVYYPSLRGQADRKEYRTFTEWLIDGGAEEPSEDQLRVVTV